MAYQQNTRPPGQNFSLNLDDAPNKGRKPDFWGFNELTCPHCQSPIRWRFSLWWRHVKSTGKYFLGGEASEAPDQAQPPIRPSNPPSFDEHGRHLNAGFAPATPGPRQNTPPGPPPPTMGTAGEHAMAQQPQPVYNPEAVDEYGRPFYPPQAGNVPRYQGD